MKSNSLVAVILKYTCLWILCWYTWDLCGLWHNKKKLKQFCKCNWEEPNLKAAVPDFFSIFLRANLTHHIWLIISSKRGHLLDCNILNYGGLKCVNPNISNAVIAVSLEWKVGFQHLGINLQLPNCCFRRHQNVYFDFLTLVPAFDMTADGT